MIRDIANLFFPILDFIYAVTHSWGWSIVLFAGLAKVALIPLANNQFKGMKEMQAIQPEIKRLQDKNKDNPQMFQKEFQALLKSRKVNPFSGCIFSMVIQLPILWALYYVIRDHIDKFATSGFLWIGPFGEKLAAMFPALSNNLYQYRGLCSIGVDKLPSFPFLATSLAGTDWPLLILYGVSMVFYSKITGMGNSDPQAAQTQRSMNMIMPVMSVIIFANFPSAFILYWLVYNAFSVVHQYLFYKFYVPEPVAISGGSGSKRRNTTHA